MRSTSIQQRLVVAALVLFPCELLAQEAPAPREAPSETIEVDVDPDSESAAPGEVEADAAEGDAGADADTDGQAQPEGEAVPPSDLPPEGIPVPVYQQPAPEASEDGAEEDEEEPLESGDSIRYSGYLPGYSQYFEFGGDPAAPAVGGLPGPTTAGYGAPMPPNEWTFTFSGFLTVSSQLSLDHRPLPAAGQSERVTHVLPETIDTYAYFTSTNALPGNWANLRFQYGNSKVSVNFSIDTYNPSAPTTFYQLGSQYFINNAFLSYSPAPLAGFNLNFQIGRFNLNHGSLGQYGNGMYVNVLGANMQGIGLRTLATRSINPKWELYLEHNLMQSRDGTIPFNVVRNQNNGWRRPLWVGSVMHGVHAGFNIRSEPRVEVRARQLVEFAFDDRLEREFDDPGTREVDETSLGDPSITIYGADVKILDDTFGVLGVGASYNVFNDAFPLRGLQTYAGIGEDLTQRFLGTPSGGNGALFVAGVNYDASIGKVVSYPQKFDGQGRDLLLQTSFHYTRTESDFDGFDGRQRYKGALDLEYVFHEYMSVAGRADRVVPDSREKEQSFWVVAPRFVMRTSWSSRMYFTVKYVKWFLGEKTRNEGAGERDPAQLDDELFAVNMNMWW